MKGVPRSWAVPKGLPTQVRQARLAMHVEDHPLEYADFDSTIPSGNYGAGTVMVWDRGEYEELSGKPVAAFYAGKLHIRMRGTKLKGEWILVKDRVEVRFDHVTANRFRHGTKLIRWRPDKAPNQCTMNQLARKQSILSRLLG